MTTGVLPPDSQESRARREQLASAWETPDAVLSRLPDAAERIQADQLLRVWVPELQAYRYPDFQFDGEGRPILEFAAVLAMLRTVVRSDSGWEEIEWFVAPHPMLDTRTPAIMLQRDPQEVLTVATRQFTAHLDAGW